jgi:CheY-like chemotaxis protein
VEFGNVLAELREKVAAMEHAALLDVRPSEHAEAQWDAMLSGGAAPPASNVGMPEAGSPSRRPESARPATPRAPDLTGVKVLVVDDDEDARILHRWFLEEAHAQVMTAASGAEALRLLESTSPDILLSDISMPGMDGYELLERVHALPAPSHRNLPAVALTAFARSGDRERALGTGYGSYLTKPVEPAELVVVIARLAGRT